MNKSLITNLIAAGIFGAGLALNQPILLSIGLFALSGAATNWLAVHMLFEKIPGLYGSGIIPLHFEAFKSGIHNLMMKQFFTAENIDRFLSDGSGHAQHFEFGPIIEKVDLEPAFHSLVATVQESSFGSMLSMFGGKEALMPLQEPFITKMKKSLVEITESDKFNELLLSEMEQPDMIAGLKDKVADIVQKRLDELTPEMVKEIIQAMIKKHLGWLVVWGGVFGGFFGLVAALI